MWLILHAGWACATRMIGLARATHVEQEPLVDIIHDAVDGAPLGAGEVCKWQHGARVVANRDRLRVDALVPQRRPDIELAKHLRIGAALAAPPELAGTLLGLPLGVDQDRGTTK